MVNWAQLDFERENITGRLLSYVDGRTDGPRVEIRISKGGHHQFVSFCPKHQWAKLFPRKRMAVASLRKHLEVHKRGVESDVSSHSEEPTRFESSEHCRRKSGAASVETEWSLGNESSSSPLGSQTEIPAIVHKETVQEAGEGDENNRPRTASLYRPSAVTVKGTGVLNELDADCCPAFPYFSQGG